MDKRKRNWITWAFVTLTILTVALMLGNTLRRTTHIELPASASVPDDPGGETPENDGGALSVVEVTPRTVRAAVETLKRPAAYSRTVTVEQIWSGGSSTENASVAVLDGWTRTDRTLTTGQVRHTLTDGETTYIWYNSETAVYAAPAGEISADNEQAIPTYEDILELEEEEITAADYRTISGLNCIYVETAADEGGYVTRYWVSVDTGLLAVAEKLLDGETVYRMAALTVAAAPAAANFTLPDGRVLLDT
ncbi:hypothetical protein [Oscillibacter sp.]|uniref:hypothetical protein n=1 Tax=Oscillibacter sp. TaxID=1945593 RepID=UPI002608C4F7|nr:hypothetical protein [Oscillibacter sp.]MDD3347543.1 hypothetical protein [Oscillibacter sp.]